LAIHGLLVIAIFPKLNIQLKKFYRRYLINDQTILLWEKDKTPISTTADRLLRIIFFEYLNLEKNRKVYDLINEIADLLEEIASNKKVNKLSLNKCLISGN
jgi:hypothetical protein